MKIRKIHIEDYKVFRDFDIELTHNNKPLNMVVVAGINGSGKTSLFEFIDNFFNYGEKPFGVNSFVEVEKGDLKTDKYNIEIIKTDSFNVLLGSPINLFDRHIIYLKAGKFDTKLAESSIIDFIDILIYEKDIVSSEAYKRVQEVLKKLLDGFELQVKFKGLDKKKEVYFKNKNSERIKVNELSTGEQELITKAFSLYLSDIKDSVILIDEPETSLHPNWQNRILKIYEDFAIANNNQIIIATHSPHIIASAKKESLRLLVKKGDKIEVVSDFDGSYGYEVQRVLLEIMNLDSLRIPGIEEKIEILHDLVNKDQYNSSPFLKLQTELEELLGRNDKDLMLLRLEIAKRKKRNEKN